MFSILNSADKTYGRAVAIGDEIFDALHKAVVDLHTFPVGSQYTNIAAGLFFVRTAAEKAVSDWVAVGGSGNYLMFSCAALSNPTAEKWGAEAVLTGLKEANVQIPVPETWTKIRVVQVNDALAKAFPNGAEGIEGNVRDKTYNYADVSGDVSEGKMSYDILALADHNVTIEATVYNGETVVGSSKFAIAITA